MKFNIESLSDLGQLVKELAIGLRNITFADNFKGFEKTVTISATSETQIRNELQNIPTKYIIVSQTGNGLVIKSNTWTKDFLYLTNNGAEEVTITIIFLR